MARGMFAASEAVVHQFPRSIANQLTYGGGLAQSVPGRTETTVTLKASMNGFIGMPLTDETRHTIAAQTGQYVVQLQNSWIRDITFNEDYGNGTIDITASAVTNATPNWATITADNTTTASTPWMVDTHPDYGQVRCTWQTWVDEGRDWHVANADNLWTTNGPSVWIPDKKAQFKSKIALQLRAVGNVHNHRGMTRRAEGPGASFVGAQQNEIVALHLLRKMADSDTFRRYLRSGVLSVRGPSGLYYAVHRKSHFVDAYYGGKHIAKLCIYVPSKHGCPPTDKVITKMVMIECDEVSVWRDSNWHVSPQELEDIKNVKKQVTPQRLRLLAVA